MSVVVRVQTYERRPIHSSSGARRRGNNRFANFLLEVDAAVLPTAAAVQAVLDRGGRVAGHKLHLGERVFLDEVDYVLPIERREPVELGRSDVRRLLAVVVRVADLEEEYAS